MTARAEGFEDATGRGKEGEPLRLVLQKLGAILAHVLGVEASPAPGARVAVAGATLWPARVATADAHGDVRIGGLAAGTYALRATKDDTVSAIEFDVTVGRGDEKRSCSASRAVASWSLSSPTATPSTLRRSATRA